MKRGEHHIRVVVEIVSDGFNVRIPSSLLPIPQTMPLAQAARFQLQNCLESPALAAWTTNPHEPPHRGD